MSSIEYINSVVLTASAATVTFSNIPDYYHDLILSSNFIKSAADSGSWFRLNNNSSSLYSTTDVRGNGSSASSGRDSSATNGRYFRGLTNAVNDNSFIMELIAYSNDNIFKTILTSASIPSVGSEVNVNLWRSTDKINEINIITFTGSYSAGSTFTLWGVR